MRNDLRGIFISKFLITLIRVALKINCDIFDKGALWLNEVAVLWVKLGDWFLYRIIFSETLKCK